ncbi:MAG: PIN domain-containing protein [Candidatus Thorarchaeota archaeon]
MDDMNYPIFYILDSSFFFGTQQIPDSTLDIYITTQEILDEIRDRTNQLRIDFLIESKKLSILKGSKENEEEIKIQLASYSNLLRLSRADLSLLVLAETLKKENPDNNYVIWTDDYEIQNIAKILNITFKPIKTKGIKRIYKYILVCKACKSKIHPGESNCENCGSNKFLRIKVK